VEAQNGLKWDQWRRIAKRVDNSGITSLFRSDHFFTGGQKYSPEAFISLAVAAAETRTVRLGTLVTPVMFRAPTEVGRMAAHIDALSSGRFVLGLGIGWFETEHRAYGIAFPSAKERFDRLEEAIRVCRSLWGPSASTFKGRYFSLSDVDCRPKPASQPLPLLLGGVGERRTLKMVAKYADEWCSEYLSIGDYRRKVDILERHCEGVSRDPGSIRRSMVVPGNIIPSVRSMVGGAVRYAGGILRPGRTSLGPTGIRERWGGALNGGKEQIVERLGEYGALGLDEAVFKIDKFESDDVIGYLDCEMAPRMRTV
jgi:F420-dependent oxidoreductase-like protein